jgi:hypothetical protein
VRGNDPHCDFRAAGNIVDRTTAGGTPSHRHERPGCPGQTAEHAMSSSATLDKIDVIQRSIRCFICGLIAFLPVIGLPFAVVAIGDFLRVTWDKGNTWNPAQLYLRAGLVCAVAGLLLATLLGAVIFIETS